MDPTMDYMPIDVDKAGRPVTCRMRSLKALVLNINLRRFIIRLFRGIHILLFFFCF